MKFLRILFSPILMLLKAVLYEWIVRLIELIRILCQRCRSIQRKRDLPGRQRKTAKQPCVPISDPAYKRPDPLIYAQYYLMAQGYAVTWDNPDIEVHKGGVLVPSHALDPDTDYELVARIWNNSTEAPVVGLPVQFSFLSFGAGVQSHFIGQTHVNLGVKGGPNHPAFATVPWKTPATAGHYCVQVGFEWIDDLNPFNNLGQENTNVGTAHSPAEFEFQLRNNTRRRQKFDLDVDTYKLPRRDPCPPQGAPGTGGEKGSSTAPRIAGTMNNVPPKHRRENYPVPPGWSVKLDPAAPILDPNEEITVQVTITPPDTFTGRQPFNVNAFHSKGLAGGVTLFVERA
jgi:hypothetical protein